MTAMTDTTPLALAEALEKSAQLLSDEIADPDCNPWDVESFSENAALLRAAAAKLREMDPTEFINFVLRQTVPERAQRNGVEFVHSAILHHPFVSDFLKGQQDMHGVNESGRQHRPDELSDTMDEVKREGEEVNRYVKERAASIEKGARRATKRFRL